MRDTDMRLGIAAQTMLVCCWVFCQTALADQVVTTSDGRKVMLKDDGTWQYVPPPPPPQPQAPNPDSQAAAAAAEKRQKDGKFNLSGSNFKPVEKKETSDEEDARTALVDVIKGDKAFDVRKSRWGMTKEEVKKTEDLHLLSEDKNMLEYKFVLLGLKSKIQYQFAGNRLVGAEYVIQQDDVNPSKFYEDFTSLQSYLQQIYGNPVADEKIWMNDIYKGDEKNWGFAISLGFLTCKTAWQSAATKIVLNQTGGNHLISTNIQYSRREKGK
jgi:hypothetical protein